MDIELGKFVLLPAIDIKNGQCVRLQQGDMARSQVFSDSPLDMAKHWVSLGATNLHLVDLDGAFSGNMANRRAIDDILNELSDKVYIQVGGGIRDAQSIEHYLNKGARAVVVGTAAIRNPGFAREACSAFSGQIIVALDAMGGKVVTDGWSKLTGHDVVDLALKYQDYGMYAVLYTDVMRDGMMSGINFEATLRLANSLETPVLASGGIAHIDDIRRLLPHKTDGIGGVVLGRSIYEKAIDLPEALALVKSDAKAL